MKEQQALWMRLREEKWADYEVASGKADRVPKLLRDLASRKAVRSMKASHDLWRVLCSGGVRSAAVPAVPYLMEIMQIASKDVKAEIADVLKCCALGAPAVEGDWREALFEALRRQKEGMGWYLKRARGDQKIAIEAAYDALCDLG